MVKNDIWVIPYKTKGQREKGKECETHHFRFTPNLVVLFLTSRKEVSDFRF